MDRPFDHDRFSLISEGMNFHIPKGFIYFSMAFSILIEMINIQIKSRE